VDTSYKDRKQWLQEFDLRAEARDQRELGAHRSGKDGVTAELVNNFASNAGKWGFRTDNPASHVVSCTFEARSDYSQPVWDLVPIGQRMFDGVKILDRKETRDASHLLGPIPTQGAVNRQPQYSPAGVIGVAPDGTSKSAELVPKKRNYLTRSTAFGVRMSAKSNLLSRTENSRKHTFE